jgi:hypothetical protein
MWELFLPHSVYAVDSASQIHKFKFGPRFNDPRYQCPTVRPDTILAEVMSVLSA